VNDTFSEERNQIKAGHDNNTPVIPALRRLGRNSRPAWVMQPDHVSKIKITTGLGGRDSSDRVPA
jgi:hypothetical protein